MHFPLSFGARLLTAASHSCLFLSALSPRCSALLLYASFHFHYLRLAHASFTLHSPTHRHTHIHTLTKAAAVFIVMPCILPLTHVRALKIPFQQQFQLVILFARGIMALSFNWQPQWQQLCRLPQKLTDIPDQKEIETQRQSGTAEWQNERERYRDREGRGTGLHSFTITTIGRCEPMRDKLLAATAAVV